MDDDEKRKAHIAQLEAIQQEDQRYDLDSHTLAQRMFYDPAGRAIALSEWQVLTQDEALRRVALDEVNGYRVSTVWIGINNNLLAAEPYGTFETMISRDHADKHTYAIWRYSTKQEAAQGHKDIVEFCKTGSLDLDVVDLARIKHDLAE